MLKEVKIELTNKCSRNCKHCSSNATTSIGNSCSPCSNYSVCKSGCIGQKIIANYNENENKVQTLKKCINSKDPKCMR